MPTVTVIQPNPKPPTFKRVGVYCRVSSKHNEQLASLANQVSYFTQVVMNHPEWRLTDFYIDIKSAETVYARTEFQRLLHDCQRNKLDLVITRSISRFGRDTVELLNAIRELRSLGVGVLFHKEMIQQQTRIVSLLLQLLKHFPRLRMNLAAATPRADL